MALKHHKYSFDERAAQLVTQYGFIPSINTINIFIRNCFYNPLKGTYANLNETDRKRAYFSDFLGSEEEFKEMEGEYKVNFPQSTLQPFIDEEYPETKLETANTFEDLAISDLSIEILNDYFFEYHLSSEIKSFKANFDAVFNDSLSSKHHQLLALMDKIEERRLFVNKVSDSEQIFENIDYPKLKDIVDSAQKDLNIFLDNKRTFLEMNMGKSLSVHKEGVKRIVRKIIDGDNNLNLYQEYQDYLIQNDYLDGNSLSWIDDGGKSSFMRFYSKCEEHKLIKRGKRSKQIRILSDAYKIDGVNKYDYSPKRCDEALSKNPDEFKELNEIKSLFGLNS
ncbi:MAG: hypothetical protein AAF600_11285 [Bacteroidota bacterium]